MHSGSSAHQEEREDDTAHEQPFADIEGDEETGLGVRATLLENLV
jgi:hypothetical protein